MNKTSTMDMTEGKPLRLIMAFGLPLLINALFQQLYGVADSIVVSRFAGINAFAGINSSSAYYGMALNSVVGFAQGFGLLLGQRFGAKDYPGLRRATAHAVLLTLLLSVAFSAVFFILARPALSLIQTPADIYQDAYAYLSLMLPALAATFCYNTAIAVLYALGNSRAPLNAAILSSLLNIALDLVFIGALRMGALGAAAATVCATVCSLFYCLLKLRQLPLIRLLRKDYARDRASLRELLRLGSPLALRGLVIAIGAMVVQTVINGYGTPFVAGVSAANKYYNLISIVGTVMDGSIAIFVAQNYGAANLHGIKEGMRQVQRIAIISAVVIGALTVIFGRGMIGLFIPENSAGAAKAIEAGYQTLRAYAVCLLPLHMLILYRAGLQGLGNSALPMLSGFTELGMRLISVLLLRIWIGAWAVYYAAALGWIGAAVLVVFSYAVVYPRRAESAVWRGRPEVGMSDPANSKEVVTED